RRVSARSSSATTVSRSRSVKRDYAWASARRARASCTGARSRTYGASFTFGCGCRCCPYPRPTFPPPLPSRTEDALRRGDLLPQQSHRGELAVGECGPVDAGKVDVPVIVHDPGRRNPRGVPVTRLVGPRL